jgi:hypothetical protein
MPNRTKDILLVSAMKLVSPPEWRRTGQHACIHVGTSTEMRILSMDAKQGPNVLSCMPNMTKGILLVSVMEFPVSEHADLPA